MNKILNLPASLGQLFSWHLPHSPLPLTWSPLLSTLVLHQGHSSPPEGLKAHPLYVFPSQVKGKMQALPTAGPGDTTLQVWEGGVVGAGVETGLGFEVGRAGPG